MERIEHKGMIYLAGALRGNIIKKTINMITAKKWALHYWKSGYIVYSPHLNSGWLDTPETDKFVLPANLEILRRCDKLVVMPNWRNSRGTIQEVKFAKKHGIPIVWIEEQKGA